MKKTLTSLSIYVMIFFCSILLFGCNINNNSSNNNNEENGDTGQETSIVTLDADKISGFVANINNATALGISKSNATRIQSNQNTKNQNTRNQNYIVMSTTTEEYEGNNPEVDENGLAKVSFTKIITENITTGLTGNKYITANSKQIDTKIVSSNSNSITIKTIPNYEYKIVDKNGNSLSDWILTDEETYTFENINYSHKKDIVIKYRSLNASVSFIATEGFTYKILYNNEVLHSDIVDNGSLDKNSKDNIISIDGLIEGEVYSLEYTGIGQEVEITQDEINGEIDKLYVYNNFTFMSFVPLGTSLRPNDSSLKYDTDGISFYDKCDYYSNNARQSFIIDNNTGYVYLIKNFNIKKIEGGCLISADDNFIYDFKINENDEIEIFSLFQNNSIQWYSCFKDKYGNKFIRNNRLNTYDTTTNTYFYVFNSDGDYAKNINYELTSNNEAIKYEYKSYGMPYHNFTIMLANGNSREITSNDNFEIYWNSNNSGNVVYKVKDGLVYGYSPHKGYSSNFIMYIYNCENGMDGGYKMARYSEFNIEYFLEYDILIEFKNNDIYYYTDIWSSLEASLKNPHPQANSYYYEDVILSMNGHNPILLLEDCNLDNHQILTYGINGNIYYDLVVEEVDGDFVVKCYEYGTYDKEQIIITLQPLSRY